jgi:hypothetical protein
MDQALISFTAAAVKRRLAAATWPAGPGTSTVRAGCGGEPRELEGERYLRAQPKALGADVHAAARFVVGCHSRLNCTPPTMQVSRCLPRLIAAGLHALPPPAARASAEGDSYGISTRRGVRPSGTTDHQDLADHRLGPRASLASAMRGTNPRPLPHSPTLARSQAGSAGSRLGRPGGQRTAASAARADGIVSPSAGRPYRPGARGEPSARRGGGRLEGRTSGSCGAAARDSRSVASRLQNLPLTFGLRGH